MMVAQRLYEGKEIPGRGTVAMTQVNNTTAYRPCPGSNCLPSAGNVYTAGINLDSPEYANIVVHAIAHYDRALELGVENYGTGRGVAVEDFDGDQDLDLIATGSFGGVRYYRNEGGARFTDETAGSGLETVLQPLTVSMADYNGDGRAGYNKRLRAMVKEAIRLHYRLLAADGGASPERRAAVGWRR